MIKRISKTTLLTMLFFQFLGCSNRDEKERALRIAILGQSVIHYDPREFYDDPMAEIKETLSEADAVITNLEMAIETNFDHEKERTTYFHGTGTEVLDFLKFMKINMLSMANNHTSDLGEKGILNAVHEVEKRGFAHSGCGKSLEEASSVAYLDTPAGKVAMIGLATAGQCIKAGENQPGLNFLEAGNEADEKRILEAIREASKKARHVIVSQHCQDDPCKSLNKEEWAKRTIDAGATIYLGHGATTFDEVEMYKGKPIFYNLGNFIFQTKTPVGRYEAETWQSFITLLDYANDQLKNITFIALQLDEKGKSEELFIKSRGFPSVAKNKSANEIIGKLKLSNFNRNYRRTTQDNRLVFNLE